MKKSAINYTFNDEKEVEIFVGIEAFSSNAFGIGGLYKYSYKDFIVKEITKNGYVLQIKDYPTPSSISNDRHDKYTSFNLVKVNKDTFEAVRLISRALNIPVDSIQYSGLKDKCAISVQMITIRGNYVKQLEKISIKDLFIRNLSQTRNPVKLGSNWGNNFTITIRNIEKRLNQQSDLENLLEFLQNQGFPNYYGLQRFGTFRPNSHLVGRYLLENNFKKAVEELVMTSYSTELEISRNVREALRRTGDYLKAIDDFPKSLNYERILIKYLSNHPGDYEDAIGRLPQYLIKIILSSFQSFLFNKMLSLRIKSGYSFSKPTEGDSICILDDNNGQITKTKYIYGKEYDKFLNEAIDINRAKVVIPLIGYNTDLDDFPLMKSLLTTILNQENIEPRIFENELLKKFEFKGSFRPIIIKPSGLKILEFDKDELFPDNLKVKIEFSLQKGSYATMLLRELMKN